MMKRYTRFKPSASLSEGATPGFESPQDGFRTANLVTTAICVGLVNTAFIIHAYVKLMVRRGRVLQEDCFCLAAWVFVNGLLASTLSMGYFGEGRSIWELSKDEYINFLKSLYISSCFYTPAAFCTKVTLLLLIARVFSVRPMISKSIRVFIVLLVLAYVPIECLKIFTCHPISAYWEVPETAGVTGDNPKCLDQAKFFMGDILIALITDLIILILPIPLAWTMTAPRRQKIKIVILLGAGGIATISTGIRAYLNVQFMDSTGVLCQALIGLPDITKDFALSSISTVLELSVGLLCACLPSANILLEKAMSRLNCPSPRHIQETQTTPDSKTSGTVSSYWSSVKSMIIVPTIRTLTIRGDPDVQNSYRSRGYDIEMGSQIGPVIFNNRLDLPSLRSTSDNGSFLSRDEYHQDLSPLEVEYQSEHRLSIKGDHDEIPVRKDSAAVLDTG